jgi:ankyrin repeat protein
LPNESETDPIVRTAFGRAAAQGNIAGMRLLLERGAQLSAAERDAALYAAVESAHLDSMRFLAQRGARLSAERAQRLLFDAMRWNDIAPLQFLFTQGANPTLASDRKGRTPLQHALFQQNEQVLAFLKSKGITPTAEDLASVERWRLEPQKRISTAGR